MEVFIDFGLFELLAALGLAALARVVYSRRWLGLLFLGLSAALPLALVFLVRQEALRWLAAANLGTALVNAAALLESLKSTRGREFPSPAPGSS